MNLDTIRMQYQRTPVQGWSSLDHLIGDGFPWDFDTVFLSLEDKVKFMIDQLLNRSTKVDPERTNREVK